MGNTVQYKPTYITGAVVPEGKGEVFLTTDQPGSGGGGGGGGGGRLRQ